MWKLISEFVTALENGDQSQFQFFLLVFSVILAILYVIGYINKIIAGYFQTMVSTYLDTKYMKSYLLMDNNKVEMLGTGQANNIVKRGIGAWMGIINTILSSGIGALMTIVTALILIWLNNPRQVNVQVVVLFICFAILWMYAYERVAVFRRVRRDINTAWDKLYVKIFMSKFEILQDHKISAEVQRYTSYIPEMKKSYVDSANTELMYVDSTRMIIDMVRLAIFFVGWSMVLYGEIAIGDLVFYVYLLGIVVSALWSVNGLTSILTEYYVYVEKLRNLFDETPQIGNYITGPDYRFDGGEIAFEKMGFGYEHRTVFRDFDLRIPAWSICAFVWPSGCGKSTLAKMIGWYLAPESGKLLIDGQDATEFNLRSYYLHTGYLTQEPSVFDGTIYENLVYAIDDRVSDKMVRDAIAKAECEFIYDLEKSWDTPVGERWIALSGGQRQRLAIAKILIKNPDIIILDEPTSALDSFSEHEISEMFYEVFATKTIIVVAHRLQTVMRADEIIVLRHGEEDHDATQIVQRGTHKELLADIHGMYASMYRLQMWQ